MRELADVRGEAARKSPPRWSAPAMAANISNSRSAAFRCAAARCDTSQICAVLAAPELLEAVGILRLAALQT